MEHEASRSQNRQGKSPASKVRAASSIAPEDVQDYQQLGYFLNQSMTDQYREFEIQGRVTQGTTYVKSYIVELHQNGRPDPTAPWKPLFKKVLTRRDESLLLLQDRQGTYFFADLSNPRFPVLHSIGKTEHTDPTIERLTQGTIEGFDRAWLPTDFLFGSRLGVLRGFKFGHKSALTGLSTDDQTTIEPIDFQNADDENDQFDEDRQSSAPEARDVLTSRLTVSNTLRAEQDYYRIKRARVFEGRQALDAVQFMTADDQLNRLTTELYSSGKVVGNGTSVGLHLLAVNEVRSSYSRAITRIEDDYSLGWVRAGDAFVYGGEPVVFLFPDGMINDLPSFVSSLFSSIRPFRLFGIPHSETNRRIDVEGIDLHTNDLISFEITHDWMRAYLPKGACGNIIARLYANLQHAGNSEIQLVSGSGEKLFTEADARVE